MTALLLAYSDPFPGWLLPSVSNSTTSPCGCKDPNKKKRESDGSRLCKNHASNLPARDNNRAKSHHASSRTAFPTPCHCGAFGRSPPRVPDPANRAFWCQILPYVGNTIPAVEASLSIEKHRQIPQNKNFHTKIDGYPRNRLTITEHLPNLQSTMVGKCSGSGYTETTPGPPLAIDH